MKYDLLIRNGRVVDGTGNPWFRADLGITGERITGIGSIDPGSADAVVDAKGLVVSPGFIDVHTHNELTLMISPEAEKIHMGVTTEIVGTCGVSAAPVADGRLEELKVAFCTVGGGYGFFIKDPRVTWDWRSFDDFLSRLEGMSFSVNVGSYVGHLNLRAATSGLFSTPATSDEIDSMKELLEESLEAGAFGLSTALSYVNAPTEEIVELCKVMREHGGHYAQHPRDHSIASTAEGIEIAGRSGVPLQLSHHSLIGQADEDFSLIEGARERGVDVTMDHWFVPYSGAAGPINRLPGWAREGGLEKVLRSLGDPETRARIKEELSGIPEGRWRGTVLRGVDSPASQRFLHMNFVEIAEARGVDPFDAMFDMYVESGGVMEIDGSPTFVDDRPPELHPEMVRYMRSPLMMVASDSMLESNTPFMPDPRAYGVFPGVLQYYVRERGYLTLEEAVRKMTSLPAQRMGIMDRGVLREGAYADVVVFDPDTIESTSVPGFPEKANRKAKGIDLVVVNGVITVEGGVHTGERAGVVLRSR
jgi:N-acyl-D-amino-acid deacylase